MQHLPRNRNNNHNNTYMKQILLFALSGLVAIACNTQPQKREMRIDPPLIAFELGGPVKACPSANFYWDGKFDKDGFYYDYENPGSISKHVIRSYDRAYKKDYRSYDPPITTIEVLGDDSDFYGVTFIYDGNNRLVEFYGNEWYATLAYDDRGLPVSIKENSVGDITWYYMEYDEAGYMVRKWAVYDKRPLSVEEYEVLDFDEWNNWTRRSVETTTYGGGKETRIQERKIQYYDVDSTQQ